MLGPGGVTVFNSIALIPPGCTNRQGVYAVSAALFSLPGGLLSDSRLGRRGTLALGFCLQVNSKGYRMKHSAFGNMLPRDAFSAQSPHPCVGR